MRPILRPGNNHSPRRNRAAWGIFFTLTPIGTVLIALILAGTVITL